MAHAIEAPVSSTAEGPTSHTQNQGTGQPANTFGYTRDEQFEALRKLREPFDPKEIRYLPRVWCGACKNSRGQGCQKHSMTKCGNCKQRMPNGGHIDLRYVGHAEATNRLLNVDPFWGYEPLSLDERGLPQLDGYKGLWIRLTVCGMTRLGYGHAGDKTGGDAVKEIIGDAIRNAGMRFGMALDLWTSSELEIIESGVDPQEQDAKTGAQSDPSRPAAVKQEQGGDRQESREQAFARLTEQYRNCWANPLALEQIRLEGKKLGFSDDRVQGPPPDSEWTTFDKLLAARIAEQNGAEQRAA